jgi:lipoic acid synthetase
MPGGPSFIKLSNLLKHEKLHTVCEEAKCPNIGECWNSGTATFMILGDICTRHCRYCAVTSGRPLTLDLEEPARLAITVERLNLSHCVITSVNRDDLTDGGSYIFAECIRQIRRRLPNCQVEVLVPDFQGDLKAIETVMQASPDVLNHNIETVRRIFHRVRPLGGYNQSLQILSYVKHMYADAVTKSGLMVGLGEEWDEIVHTMEDLRSANCDLITIGQYLRPSPKHEPLHKFYSPEEFTELQHIGEQMGFRHVASGPLVRSSYHASEQLTAARLI